jgi:hypothetical protein
MKSHLFTSPSMKNDKESIDVRMGGKKEEDKDL